MRGTEDVRGDSLVGGVWPPHHLWADLWSGLVISLLGQEAGLEAELTENLEQENFSSQSEAG